jgi:hypothetical protein
MADADFSDLQLVDKNTVEEYENEDEFKNSLGANIDDGTINVGVPDTATSGLVWVSNIEASSINSHKRKER